MQQRERERWRVREREKVERIESEKGRRLRKWDPIERNVCERRLLAECRVALGPKIRRVGLGGSEPEGERLCAPPPQPHAVHLCNESWS